MKKLNKTFTKLIVIGILSILMAVLLVLKNDVDFCEFVATTFARGWIWFFGNVLGWIPISFYELFLVVAIGGLIAFIVVSICRLTKKQGKRVLSGFLSLIIIVLSGVNIYTATASFTYNRKPLPDEIYTEYSGKQLSYDDALAIAYKVVGEVNKLYKATEHDTNGNVVLPKDKQLNNALKEAYAKLPSGYLSRYTPKTKRIINKWIMSQMHVVGVFFTPFGEANINGYERNLYSPYTMAHELAHAKGVMRESDAKVVGLLALLNSTDDYLRYSAMVTCLWEALDIVALYPDSQNDYATLYYTIDEGIIKEIQNYHAFYDQFVLFDDIGEFFNDLYLKLQNQSGVDSYDKPPVTEGTGEYDSNGAEIEIVLVFSEVQNLLIGLYKQQLL